MKSRNYTFKTCIGTTIVPNTHSLPYALMLLAQYHLGDNLAGVVDRFWDMVSSSGMTIKVSKPIPGPIVHTPPKPKKPRKQKYVIGAPPTVHGACVGCGSFSRYQDSEDVIRCSECERART